MHDNAGLDYAGENLVFLGGCPRSGTTWLQRMLSCHPAIRTAQESFIFPDYIMPLYKAWHRNPETWGRPTGLAAYFTDAQFSKLLKSFLVSLLGPMTESLQPGQLFLEKTPSNALYLREITAMLPGCRIINIVRDPRDVVASLLAVQRSWGPRWAPKDARNALKLWKDHVRTAHEARAALPSWQFFDVRYEQLHAQSATVLRECAAFLGLSWTDADIARALEENDPARARTANGGSPIAVSGELQKHLGSVFNEPRGFVRRARVGSWKADLSVFEKAQVLVLARKDMIANGYAWPFPLW